MRATLIRNSWIVVLSVMLTSFLQVKRAGAQDRHAADAGGVVRRALAAMGGEGDFAAIRTVRLEGRGTAVSTGQGRSPADPVSRNRVEVSWWVDLESESFRRRRQTFQEDEGYFCFDSVYTPDEAYNFECIAGIDMPIAAAGAERGRSILRNRFPEPRGRLLSALENEETLEHRAGSDNADIVTYTDGTGTKWELEFEPPEGLLRRATGAVFETPMGELHYIEEYSDYRAVGDFMIPTRVRTTSPIAGSIGWVSIDDLTYRRVAFDESLDETLFSKPDGAFPRRPDEEIAETEVATGVTFLENVRPNYNQLVVEFDDFVAVVDAPFNDEVSRGAIEKINEISPGKPIRYLILTHFHYDHIGGLSSYVEEGATVVTTRGNRDFVRDLLDRTLTVRSGLPFRQPVRIESIEDHWQIPGEGPVVELFDVGPNPHADELLAVHLPEPGILYVADVFSPDWGKLRPAIPETREFARTLESLGLSFDILLPSHGPRSTRADLQQSLRLGSTASSGIESE